MIAKTLYQGGGILITGGNVNIDNSQISSNTANYVSMFSNLLKLSMAFFHGPHGWLQSWLMKWFPQGGGIYIGGGNLNIDNSEISSNQAPDVRTFLNLLKPSMTFFHDPHGWLQSCDCNHDDHLWLQSWLPKRLCQGGGIYISGGTVNIDTSQILSNTAYRVSTFSNLLKNSMAFFHDPHGWLQSWLHRDCWEHFRGEESTSAAALW
jgi:large exoprotein involved in heme utilization and adhesion